VTEPQAPARRRWLVLAVFVLSSAINYLDRQALAALAPVVCSEFHLSNTQYGFIQMAFNLTYAASAPVAGLLIDRFGLNLTISLAVALWSGAGIATGFTRGLGGLMRCRAVLGVAEAAGIPAAGKAIHQHLAPAERAMGNAVNQAGVSLGAIVAPPLATWIAVSWGWRQAFVVTGILGLLWIPLWHTVARRSTASDPAKLTGSGGRELLRDRRLWIFMAANALSMVGYALWMGWTTKYLVDARGLTLVESAWIAWLPPLFATVGGFGGGWLSLRIVRRGLTPLNARYRVCLAASVVALLGAAVPLAPTAGLAAGIISLSICAVAAFSVNMYTMPLDAFGGARAAFAVSMLTGSYGAVSAAVSPLFGWLIDHHGYAPVTTIAALAPVAACGVLWSARLTR
jgi:ACS family hexuronate transporter-like MFS transporter